MEIGPKYKLFLRRGDSHGLWVDATDAEGKAVAFEPGDIVRLTVRNSAYDPEPELQLTVTEFEGGKAYFLFEPEATKSLDFKEYVYDIELTRLDGWVDTIIPPKDKEPLPGFVITEEST